MKRIHWRKNEGLTLVELMVSIAIGTMIFAAATTVLLLGIRIHHHTTDAIQQQYTARTVITMMEQMAEEGSVNKTYRTKDGSWKLGTKVPNKDNQEEHEFEKVMLSYSSKDQTVFTGDYESENKSAILENVVASYIVLDENVLTVSLEDTEGTYSSSVYCRIAGMSGGKNFESLPNESIAGATDKEEKERFLLLLNSQIGKRGGFIDHEKELEILDEASCGCGNRKFFSEWFLPNGYDEEATAKGWGPDTPWCGCFVSWGLVKAGLNGPSSNLKWFENVDTFMKYFKTRAEQKNCWKIAGSTPLPGDLIFFDMVGGTTDNPSHMGAVLSVKNGKVTTIEGNSADMVAVREYDLTDPRIIGYGDPWAAQTN